MNFAGIALSAALIYAVLKKQDDDMHDTNALTKNYSPSSKYVAELATEYRHTGIPTAYKFLGFDPAHPDIGYTDDVITSTGDPFLDAAYLDAMMSQYHLGVLNRGINDRVIYAAPADGKAPTIITSLSPLPGVPDNYVFQNPDTFLRPKLGRAHEDY